MAVLPPNSSAALQAFAAQIEPGQRTASGPPAARRAHAHGDGRGARAR